MADLSMTADTIQSLLTELDTRLQHRGVEATMFIVGGAAMALAYNATRITDDIDAVLQPRDIVLDAARDIATERGINPHWLSDAVTQVMPPRPDDHPRSLRIGRALTVEIASPEYILAMKAMTSRQSTGDRDDAITLCHQLAITTVTQLEAIVARYFTGTYYGAQELFFERIIDSL